MSQHSEQQCDKLQTVSGAVGGEKRKSRLKDSKKNSDKHDLDQKIYILDLERKVKEQDKTINLLSKRIDMMSSEKGQDSSEFSPKMDNPVSCGNTQPQSTTQTELVTMEMRMRQLEFSMLQSMAMFTTCTAQLNMQLQNQNTLINNVQNNQYTQGSINPYQPYSQPTGGHPPTISHKGNQPTFGGFYQPPTVSLNGAQMNNVGFHQHPMGPQQSFTGVSQPSMIRPTAVNPSMNGFIHPSVVPPIGNHLVPQPHAIPVFCPQPGFRGLGGLPVGTTVETQQQQQQQHLVPPPFFSVPPPAMNRAPPMSAYNQSAPQLNSSANNRDNHGIKYQHSHNHLTSIPTVASIPKERTEEVNLSPMGEADNALSRRSERRRKPFQDTESGSVEKRSCLDGGMTQKKRVTAGNPEIPSTYPDNRSMIRIQALYSWKT